MWCCIFLFTVTGMESFELYRRCLSFLISSHLLFFFHRVATLSTLTSLFVLCPRPVLCCIVPPMYRVQKPQIFIKVQIFKWRKQWLFLVSGATPVPAEMKRFRQLYSNPRTCTNTRYATMRVLSRCCMRNNYFFFSTTEKQLHCLFSPGRRSLRESHPALTVKSTMGLMWGICCVSANRAVVGQNGFYFWRTLLRLFSRNSVGLGKSPVKKSETIILCYASVQ